MRNLKRALSLAVSTVMLIGMMAVGTSAASYADVDSADNVEAIEVMQAVSVMVGDENGNFNPDKNVTRAEMAVVMANLLDLQVEDFVGASIPFTDVPQWAHSFVAACYADGITGGISATQYGSNNSITAVQAALMMMKALGYFQFAKDFGTDWQVATIKQASNIGLYDGIDSARNAAMTRNEVAQLALNTLKTTMVESDGSNTDITLPGDITIATGDTKYVDVTSTSTYARAFGDKAVEGSKYTVELGEKLFDGDLKLNTNATDAFGRPGDKWTYKTTTIGTYADKANMTYTEDVELGDIYSDLGLSERTEAAYIRNGVDQANVVLFRGNSTKLGTGNGVLTEAYVDDDNNVTLVAIDTYVGQVNRSVAATSSKDAYIVIGTKDQKPVSGGTVEYETDASYEDDAYVLYTYADNAVQSVALAEMVSGTVDSYTASKSLNLDGTTYKYAAKKSGVTDPSTKSDYDVYLDQYGYAIYVDEQEFVSSDYAYVLDAQGGSTFVENKAKLVFTDGTTKVVNTEKNYSDSGSNNMEQQFVTYKVNDDNTYTLRKVTNGITNIASNGSFKLTKGTAAITTGGSPTTLYANSNTIFIVATKDGDDTVYDTYTGVANVPSITAQASTGQVSGKAYCKTSGMATIMYIDATASGVNISTSSSEVTYIASKSEEGKIVSSNGDYYLYNAVVNGEITTIKANAQISTNKVYGSVSYDSDDILNVSSAKDHSKLVTPSSAGTVKQSGSSTIGFGNGNSVAYWSVAKDCKVFYVDADGKITESSLSGISTDTDDTVLAVQNDGELTYIFIQEVTAGASDPGSGNTSGDYSVALSKGESGKITLTITSTATTKPEAKVTGTIKMGGSTTLTADLTGVSEWSGSANNWTCTAVIANTSSNTVTYQVDVVIGSTTLTTNILLGG